jgi:hypothetical protein
MPLYGLNYFMASIMRNFPYPYWFKDLRFVID